LPPFHRDFPDHQVPDTHVTNWETVRLHTFYFFQKIFTLSGTKKQTNERPCFLFILAYTSKQLKEFTIDIDLQVLLLAASHTPANGDFRI
jgi:hypothetical protein